MRFTLTIELGNEAMNTGCDVARALRTIAGDIASSEEFGGPVKQPIRDVNGNTVGGWRVKNARK